MSSSLYDGLAEAIADAAAVTDNSFTWQGNDYACVINAESGSLVVSKKLFTKGVYPDITDTIRVAGKDQQITSVSNASMEFGPGGLIQSSHPFVDDPNNPALAIVFDGYIGK